MLELSTFPAALKMAQDLTSLAEDGMPTLLASLCEFLSICLANFEWAFGQLVVIDRCVSQTMLISSFYHLNMAPESLFTTLALLISQEKDDKDNTLFRMIHKYRLPLLEMAYRADNSDDFCSVLFLFWNRDKHGDDSIDSWDPKLIESLAKKLMSQKNKTALKNMFLVSSVAQDVMLEEKQTLSGYVDALENISAKTNEVIAFLNNFAAKNPRGQKLLHEGFAIHRKIVALSVKAMSQMILVNTDSKKSLIIIICNILSLVSTLTSHCSEAKSCMVANVGLDKGKASSLMQVLVDLIIDENLGNNVIRSRIWIPNAFRIITACMTSVECRSWLIRNTKFLNAKCAKDLDSSSPDPALEILWLDLILSLTSFNDGQAWLAKNNDIIDVLVDKAAHSDSLPSLAILRNLAFHPGARKKLLLLPNYLALLSKYLGDRHNWIKLRLTLVSIWILSANCHKAKVALNRAGITRQLEQLQTEDSNEAALISITITVLTSFQN